MFFLPLSLYTESYLIGRVWCNGPRTSSACRHVWCEECDALWRRLFVASIVVLYRIQARARATYSHHTTQQPLQRWRDAAGNSLSDDSRTRTARDHAVAQTERCHPVLDWASQLSGCDKSAKIVVARSAADAAAFARVARPISSAHDK